MNMTKIACRVLGTAGMAAVCYDAAKISKQFSHIGSEHAQEHYLEHAYFNARTLDKVSYNSNVLQEKTFELRTKNPFPAIWGKIEGGVKGFMYGLANELPLVVCSSLAILGKNFLAKAGAIGIGAIALYKVLRDGYGTGKNHPMN